MSATQAYKDELIAYYQRLVNQGVNLEEHRDKKLLNIYNQLNSSSLRFCLCLRGAVCGIIPGGGFIHTEWTSRAYARQCMEAYCLDALDYPTTNFGELILEGGLTVLTIFSNSVAEMVAEGVVDASMGAIIEDAVEFTLDELVSQNLGHIPIFSSIMAAVNVQRAMTEVLRRTHLQAEALHNSAIETARVNMRWK